MAAAAAAAAAAAEATAGYFSAAAELNASLRWTGCSALLLKAKSDVSAE